MGQFLEDTSLFSPKLFFYQDSHREYIICTGFSLLKKVSGSIINNLLKLNALGPDGFTDDFLQTFKGEIVSIPLASFPEKRGTGTFPNSFHEDSTISIPKPDKDFTRKENKTSISHEPRSKNL